MNKHAQVYLEQRNATAMVIFIHGLMGSPIQFNYYAKRIYNNGYSVCSLLLPGHGKTLKEFFENGLTQWEEYLQKEIRNFSEKYESIYLVGHSIGGLLALNASINKANNIKGVFLISSPMKLNILNLKSLCFKLKLILYSKKHVIKKAYINASSIKLSGFLKCKTPLRPFRSLNRLIAITKENMHNVLAPVVIIHSPMDETVSFKSSSILFDGLCNAEKKLVLLEKSYHAYYPLTEKKLILFELISFLNKYSKI